MKNKLLNSLIIIIIVILSLGGGFVYSKLADKVRREEYPDLYSEEISAAAEKYEIPKAAISALIKVKSDFDSTKTDENGGAGLCLFTEDEFLYLAEKAGETQDPRLRYSPEVSIDLAALMLQEYYREFGDWDAVWAAVFAGGAETAEAVSSSGLDYERITDETADFIKEANKAFEKYITLWPEITVSETDEGVTE